MNEHLGVVQRIGSGGGRGETISSFSYVIGKPVVYTIRTSVDSPGLTGLVPVSRQNSSDNRIGARVTDRSPKIRSFTNLLHMV